jgi:hypothetical protein
VQRLFVGTSIARSAITSMSARRNARCLITWTTAVVIALGAAASSAEVALPVPARLARAAETSPVSADRAAANVVPDATKVRGRATGVGAAAGAAVVGAAGLLLGIVLCAAMAPDEHLCDTAGDTVFVVGAFALTSAAAGGIAGGIIGAALPWQHDPGDSHFWQRADGPLGTLGLQLGGTHVNGAANVEPVSVASRVSLLAQLGPYLAVGPEVGFYPQHRAVSSEARARQEPDLARGVIALGLAARAGLPLAAFYPYLIGGAAYCADHADLAANFGVGSERRLSAGMNLAAEIRLHSSGGGGLAAHGSFVTGTAGVSWRW